MSELGCPPNGAALNRLLSFFMGRPAIHESVAGRMGSNELIALISAALALSSFFLLLLFLFDRRLLWL